MPRVTTAELLDEARSAGRGLAAFNVIHLETAEALTAAAELTGLPMVLQISQNCVAFHGSLRPIAIATMAVADACATPVSVHLDHAEDPALVREAIDLGLSSVMYDGSVLEYADNVRSTQEAVAYAHGRGAGVEAELGKIGGKDGAHAPGVRTDPAEARAFVAETGVDALAVAVGSSHAMAQRTAELDLALIADLRAAVPVPLVLHGSSGVPDPVLQQAVAAGMTKINISTQLNRRFTAGLREYLDANPSVVDSRKYLGAGAAALRDEAARLQRLLAERA